MMKDRLKKVFVKISYILFALFISIALWMFVEITSNELHVRDIVVDEIILLNSDLLGSRGLLVSRIITDELTLTFEGPRGEINNLSSGSVNVVVDLENIRATGTYALDYTEIFPEAVNSNSVRKTGSSDSQIVLFIDRISSKEIPVEVNYTGGTISDEYYTAEPVLEPQTITVTGPEETVSKIAHVFVPIAARNLPTTYSDELSFMLIDEDGGEMSNDLRESGTLTFSHEEVRVTIPVRQIRTLTLQVELSHGKTTSESNTSWYTEPAEIKVAGDPEALKDLNSIPLGTIDMTSFGLKDTREFSIVLPNYLENLTGETKAMVMIEVLQRTLELDYKVVPNLQVANVPDGLSASIITESSVVTLRGTPANLALVQPENIWLVADLADYSAGVSRINARASIVGIDANVDIIGVNTIVVSITEN